MVCVHMFVLWRGETHQPTNISTGGGGGGGGGGRNGDQDKQEVKLSGDFESKAHVLNAQGKTIQTFTTRTDIIIKVTIVFFVMDALS